MKCPVCKSTTFKIVKTTTEITRRCKRCNYVHIMARGRNEPKKLNDTKE